MASFVNHLYEVVGRNKPTAKNPVPQIFRMKLFAVNKVIAQSRFWYFLAMLNKSKASTGEILEVNEIFEKNDKHIKNFGIQIRYNSRSGTHNMYKEYRDLTLNGAVDKMYAEMASRHRARKSSIWIVDTAVVPASKVRRDCVKQFATANVKFRLHGRIPRPSEKAFRKVYKATKPSKFF